jgi:hypothetical protein
MALHYHGCSLEPRFGRGAGYKKLGRLTNKLEN